MTRLRVALRLARRDLAGHRVRSIVAVLLFALPVSLVVGFASMIESFNRDDHTLPLSSVGSVEFAQDGPRVDPSRFDDEPASLHDVVGDDVDSLSAATRQDGEASAGDRSETILLHSVGDPADDSEELIPQGTAILTDSDSYLLGVSTGDTVTIDGTDLTVRTTNNYYGSAVNAADVPHSPDASGLIWYFPTDPTTADHLYGALQANEEEQDRTPAGNGEEFELVWEPESQSERLFDYSSWIRGEGGPSMDGASVPAAIAVAVLGVLLISSVISPVFAVAARRQRRAMGLMSAGGAGPPDLRRIMFAEGVMVGAVGTVLGLALSVGVGAVLTSISGYGDVMWAWDVAIPVVVVAVLCGVTSALIPAIRAGREDPVQALADGGSERMTGFRPRMLTGLLFLVPGIVYTSISSPQSHTFGVTMIGIGIILSSSLLVWLMSRAGPYLPTAGRLAVRDSLRNHHRTVPAVAAVTGVTFLAAVAMSLNPGSTEESSVRDNVAVVDGQVGGDAEIYADDVDRVADALGTRSSHDFSSVTGAEVDGRNTSALVRSPGPPDVHAADGANMSTGYYNSSPRVIDDIGVHDGSLFGIYDDADRADVDRASQAMEDGYAVTTDPSLIEDGRITIDLKEADNQWGYPREDAEPVDTRTVPAVAIPSLHGSISNIGVSMNQATADSLGLDTAYNGTALILDSPVSQIEAAMASTGLWPVNSEAVNVETPAVDGVRAGFAAVSVLLSWILTLGTILLVVLLAATESRRDMATIAAIGAAPGLLRRFSATQALFVSLAGTLTGVAFGLLPALLNSLTSGGVGFLSSTQWIAVGLTVSVGPLLAWVTGQIIGAVTSRDRSPVRRRE